jgi:hypothetical protein
MISYFNNNEIDREQWDNCIRNSPGVKPYGYSWYLDIMAPGWQALVDDDYESVFPLPGFKKYGIRYITTPIFLQQLGVFSPDKPADIFLNEFLDFLPGFYRLIDLCVGDASSVNGFKVTEKTNYELDLSSSYEVISSRFSSHCKRNINIASRKKPELVTDITPDELIDLFIANKGSEIKGIKIRDYNRLRTLMHFCIKNKKGRIIGVRTSRKKLIYGNFIVETKGNITMLLVVNTPKSREKRLGYYVVNELIKESAQTRKILDFAGSSIPSIASFMKSFGPEKVTFYRLYSNRLFWPVRMLK